LRLGEVENVYVILQQIYSGNFVPNCQSFIEDITKNIVVFFWTQHTFWGTTDHCSKGVQGNVWR